MKKKDIVFKEYIRSLSDDDLNFISFMLDEKKSGDVGEVVEFLQEDPEIDEVFLTAENAYGLYDFIDEIQECVDRELTKRS